MWCALAVALFVTVAVARAAADPRWQHTYDMTRHVKADRNPLPFRRFKITCVLRELLPVPDVVAVQASYQLYQLSDKRVEMTPYGTLGSASSELVPAFDQNING